MNRDKVPPFNLAGLNETTCLSVKEMTDNWSKFVTPPLTKIREALFAFDQHPVYFQLLFRKNQQEPGLIF
ncbi:hypothetical protein D0X99_14715 [Algoriphagus lacus]|uniref:Uncharacterized protein n=1 Tax=Algoriphagus lacus TaxID=2056311 RepID=A0A418PPP7_9BACT|nr:hypothetical protein D0X99_14715 [Algoriphagus lacus]